MVGKINPTPNIKILRESPSTASVDGDNGLGLVVGPKANQIAMDKAEKVGSGWVSVCNTNHFGIAGM
jgi:LDH2 family malate/lactate/ureidoglycolate dehydrogenase